MRNHRSCCQRRFALETVRVVRPGHFPLRLRNMETLSEQLTAGSPSSVRKFKSVGARAAAEPAALIQRRKVGVRLFAVPAVLGPQHLHRPGHTDVAEPVKATFLCPAGNNPAARAARKVT